MKKEKDVTLDEVFAGFVSLALDWVEMGAGAGLAAAWGFASRSSSFSFPLSLWGAGETGAGALETAAGAGVEVGAGETLFWAGVLTYKWSKKTTLIGLSNAKKYQCYN